MIRREVDRKNENSSMCRPLLCLPVPRTVWPPYAVSLLKSTLRPSYVYSFYPRSALAVVVLCVSHGTRSFQTNPATSSSRGICRFVAVCTRDPLCVFRDEETLKRGCLDGSWYNKASRLAGNEIFSSIRLRLLRLFDILEYRAGEDGITYRGESMALYRWCLGEIGNYFICMRWFYWASARVYLSLPRLLNSNRRAKISPF